MNIKVFGQRFGSARRIARSGVERVFSAVRSLVDSACLEGPLPREPYLQGVTASSATITWVEDDHGVGLVEYGETPHLGRERVETQAGRRHAVVLTDLEPASTYHYRVRGATPAEQKAFLERDLESTGKRWKFAFLHRSLYSSSRHGPDEKIREDLEPLFAHHGVDVVFSGHDHAYERTVSIREVTYVVSGGGGRRLYRAGKGKLTACSRSIHHAVFVHVDGSRLLLEAMEPDENVFDRWELVRA